MARGRRDTESVLTGPRTPPGQDFTRVAEPTTERTWVSVICQAWAAFERGWGQEDAGQTLHAHAAARKAYIGAHWSTYPDGPAPDYYEAPVGDPFEIWVDAEAAEAIAAVDGIRLGGDRPHAGDRLHLRVADHVVVRAPVL